MESALTLEALGFLISSAFFAGLMDAVVGGGGLITMPALLLVGVTPLQAIATNKLQGCCGTLTTSYFMLSHRLVSLSELWPIMLAAFVASALGALFIQHVDGDFVRFVLPLVLAFCAGYFLLMPQAGETARPALINRWHYGFGVVPALGLYDGALGPGTGSFLSLSAVLLRGQTIRQATANAKLLNFSTNVAALLIFVVGDHVVWLAGGAALLGQIAGALLGARLIVRLNNRLLRLLLVFSSLFMLGFWWLS